MGLLFREGEARVKKGLAVNLVRGGFCWTLDATASLMNLSLALGLETSQSGL